MAKRLRYGNLMKLFLFILLIYIVVFHFSDIKSRFEGITEETSLYHAEITLESSPTYSFDGFDLVHDSTGKMNCENCWEYLFKFKTYNSGYGDRSSDNLDNVITGHKATVFVENGEVMYIIIDNVWDELNQEYVTRTFVSND